ncbi:MAG: CNNM domain-containing protein [Phycisphaerales bacterium]
MYLAQASSFSAQTPLMIVMGILLLCSAVASASETALFGISTSSRISLRTTHPRISIAVDRLLSNPRRLLLQVLLLNMVVNVAYFIVTSILTLNAESTSARIVISIASLFSIILVGEVFAKLAAVVAPILCLRIVTPLHLVVRQPLRPLIAVLERYFILPGTRLLVPSPPPPPGITPEEMSTLLKMGTDEGLIDQTEQDLLNSIVMLSQRTVEDIMRPRVDFTWIDSEATREEVIELCVQTSTTRFPVFEGGIDGSPLGMIDAKLYLSGQSLESSLSPLFFIPEQATIDALLNQLRDNAQTNALVVDEHGTVVGLVALADIADLLLDGITSAQSDEAQEILMIGPATWSVPGRIAVHEWSTLFSGIGGATSGQPSLNISSAKTLAGLIMHTLGRVPVVDDEIQIGPASLRVISMNDLVVDSVEVKLDIDGHAPSDEIESSDIESSDIDQEDSGSGRQR